jgi:hypothetical protein
MTSTISRHDTGNPTTFSFFPVPASTEVPRPAATIAVPIARPTGHPAPAIHRAPTVYPQPQPEPRPEYHRAKHRRANPPWAWALVGAGTLLAGQFLAGLVALVVAW